MYTSVKEGWGVGGYFHLYDYNKNIAVFINISISDNVLGMRAENLTSFLET